MLVMLDRNRKASFQRYARNEKGERAEKLVFEPGVAVELDETQFAAVKKDIGGALVIVDEDGKVVKKKTADVVNGDLGTGDDITLVSQSLIPEALQKKLIKQGIEKLEDLAGLIDKSPKWYEDVDGIGEKTAVEIAEALKLHEADE